MVSLVAALQSLCFSRIELAPRSRYFIQFLVCWNQTSATISYDEGDPSLPHYELFAVIYNFDKGAQIVTLLLSVLLLHVVGTI